MSLVGVIDFETTGLSPAMGDRATEIAIVMLDGTRVVGRFQSLMNAGVRTGRIVTVDAHDKPRKRGPLTRAEAVYVYRRTGLPCRVCGTEIRTEVVVGRNLFWCPSCQAPGNAGR